MKDMIGASFQFKLAYNVTWDQIFHLRMNWSCMPNAQIGDYSLQKFPRRMTGESWGSPICPSLAHDCRTKCSCDRGLACVNSMPMLEKCRTIEATSTLSLPLQRDNLASNHFNINQDLIYFYKMLYYRKEGTARHERRLNK
jgi:hypothetical protein